MKRSNIDSLVQWMKAKSWLWVVSGLFLSGVIVSLTTFSFGLLGWLTLPFFWLLIIPLFFLALGLVKVVLAVSTKTESSTKFVWGGLLAIWATHFLGVLVPETGFDAVWYHLPVIAQFLAQGRIAYFAELYQSANPLYTDLFFLLGFQAAGELGAKLVAFGLGLTYLLMCFILAERFIASRWWQAWFLITISLIQPVAWQVSSAYVDVGRAVWELAALYFLIEYRSKPSRRWLLVLAGIAIGAAVSTKMIALVLAMVIFVLVGVVQDKKDWQNIVRLLALYVGGFFLVAAPFYVYIWLATGSPWQSFAIHFAKLDEIGGQSSLSAYIADKVVSLPTSLWYLEVQARDYVSLVLVFFLPLVVWQWQMLKQKQTAMVLLLLVIFAVTEWLIWWFTPPTSTRYAIAGFVVVLLLCFMAVEQLAHYRSSRWFWALSLVVLIISSWHVLPRLLVAKRNISYLTQQDKARFIEQFYDGNIDHHLKRWHQLP